MCGCFGDGLMSSSNAENLATACANLTLADLDDEDEAMQIQGVAVNQQTNDLNYCVVGRLVTDRPIKFPFFKDTIPSVWRPAMGVSFREIQPKLYLFQFYHEADVRRILMDGPWSYEQNLLVLKRIEGNEDPEAVDLSRAEFWVQVHHLPARFRTEAVLDAIGTFLGSFVKSDESNFDGSWRTIYRIRVELDITRPLKKKMKMKRDDEAWVVVEFRYERLPTFCFLCGIIGHSDKYCPKILRGIDPNHMVHG